ncbi:unnamed protein product [Mytilus edulis]|uniref:Prion-like-(Q/N-rich) domain-bearing protein 25 n=1 Tax=Mytilus edulis TaxID=6550 RepID=A0A8S3QVW3_MYTED|nr:unnamed protein product [Mytilus edulis]
MSHSVQQPILFCTDTGSGTKTCECQNTHLKVGTSCLKRALGESCSNVTQCTATNTVCTGSGTKTCGVKTRILKLVPVVSVRRGNGENCTKCCSVYNGGAICADTCQCPSDLFYDGTNCVKRALGDSCSDVTQCSVANTVCTGSVTKTCKCPSTHLEIGSSCLKRALGESCSDVTQCSVANTVCTGSGEAMEKVAQMLLSVQWGAICADTCQCPSQLFYDGTNCVKRALGESCSDVTQCSVANTVCTGSVTKTCECQSTHLEIGSSCLRRGNGESCTDVAQCTMGMLYVLEHVNVQVISFMMVQTVLVKQALGESCSNVTQCSVTNTVCTDAGSGTKTCECKNTHLQVGSSCFRRGNGESCTDVAQCTMGDAICSVTCQCPSHLFYDGTNCVKRALGESCSDVTQCSVTNTVCTGSGTKTCECKNTHIFKWVPVVSVSIFVLGIFH